MVMPVYNGERYLVDSVASILEQTHRDLELICVDDGSTDQSYEILNWFARIDPRVRVFRQANAGIVEALNRGCSVAQGPLIGRMDHDDIAQPDRLALQLAFLRSRPACAVVGGAILEIDSDGAPLGVSQLPADHEAILSGLLRRRTGHFHPTTLFRAEAWEAVSGYRKEYQWVEDHDLWLRMSQRGALANLQTVVLCYRMHSSSICWQRSESQRELMNRLLTEAHLVRGAAVPSEAIQDVATSRTPAGPGKWVRAAAKGGYPSSVVKHLRQLFASDAPSAYKSRMALEAVMRLPLGVLTRLMRCDPHLRVPSFPAWQNRWLREQGIAPPGNPVRSTRAA